MFTLTDPIDVLVVGSGHAGIEAALAAARLGCRTLMLTQNLDTIGQMSCNPAIGGSAKSHIVKEIDALGGAMAINADATGIQFRILNRSKGEAVWATRVQCDKKAYQFRLKAILEKTRNLRLLQGTAATLLISNTKSRRRDNGFRRRDSSKIGRDYSWDLSARAPACGRTIQSGRPNGGHSVESERQHSHLGIRSRAVSKRERPAASTAIRSTSGRSRSNGAMSRRPVFHSWKRCPVKNTNRSR